MATEKNRYGLSRYIPSDVRRAVRQACKFGCIICRAGIYTYHRFAPEFKDARVHNAAGICCLCSSCHHDVTSGRTSAALVRRRFSEVLEGGIVSRPRSPFDSHDGTAHLQIGGLKYDSMPLNILEYDTASLLRVEPGTSNVPGRFYCKFFNDAGEQVLEIHENEIVGEVSNWDLSVTGTRLEVRQAVGRLVLSLVLRPPGRLVVEHLDMRFGDIHIMINAHSWLAGRYFTDGKVGWFGCDIELTRRIDSGPAIRICKPEDIRRLWSSMSGLPTRPAVYRERNGEKYVEFLTSGFLPARSENLFSTASLVDQHGSMFIDSYLGVADTRSGIIAAHRHGGFNLRTFGRFTWQVESLREVFFDRRNESLSAIFSEAFARGAV